MVTKAVDAAKRVLADIRFQEEGRDENIVILPTSARLDLNRLVASTIEGEAYLLTMVSEERSDIDSYEDNVWRMLALNGMIVKRIYVIPHAGFAKESLDERIKVDLESGIESKEVIVSQIPSNTQFSKSEELWIIDINTVVKLTGDALKATQRWVVSCREADTRTATIFWNELANIAQKTNRERQELNLEEPLVLTADLLNEVAPIFCTSDHVDEAGCNWYHGAWQYLRILDLVSTPTWHHEFYSSALVESLLRGRVDRILISGTADYSMLAYVITAIQATGKRPEIHVIDQCATPLFACRWYGKRMNLPIHVHERSIFDESALSQLSFDLICTDAFLTRFGSIGTRKVLQRWKNLLSESGKVITTIRLHAESIAVRDGETAIGNFTERARQRAKRWEPFLKKSAAEIGLLAESYARKMRSKPVGDQQSIISDFSEVGFYIERQEVGAVPGELYPTKYLRIVARKSV